MSERYEVEVAAVTSTYIDRQSDSTNGDLTREIHDALRSCRPDYYLENLPLQPKAEIAEYIAQQRILVPRRFFSFQEALASGQPFIIRSEHPSEYAGDSGILESYRVTSSDLEATMNSKPREGAFKLKYEVIAAGLRGAPKEEIHQIFKNGMRIALKRYCDLLGLDIDEFSSKISYSYWELLGGYNRTIIADSAIPGRYHIFTFPTALQSMDHNNHTVFDNGSIIFESPTSLNRELKEQVATVVDWYESVRQLERFDSKHCPILEFQTVATKNSFAHYFLQYHRTRNLNKASFELARGLESGEVEALLVRGATPPDGIICQATAAYSLKAKIASEDAAFEGGTINTMFTKLMPRKRRVQLLDSERKWAPSQGHGVATNLFKPEISLIIDFERLGLTRERRVKMLQEALRSGEQKTLPLRIISDGRKGFVKIMH